MSERTFIVLALASIAVFAGAYPSEGASQQTFAASYRLPPKSIRISTSARLVSVLRRTKPADIVLAAGIYDNQVAYQNPHGHRLYAAAPGLVVFKAGLVIGGSGQSRGGLVRGVRFDIADTTKTFHSSMVYTWGLAGRGAKVLDSTFDGHQVIASAVRASQPEGLVVQRVVIRNVTDYGVFFQVPHPDYRTFSPLTPTLVEDVDIAGVHRTTRGSANGTAEAGVWAGNEAVLRRVKVRDTGWMGVWAGGNCNDAVFEDLDIDDIHGTVASNGAATGVGIYIEHYTRRSVFRRFKIGRRVREGFKIEWADPVYEGTNPVAGQGLGSSHSNVMEDGEIRALIDGVAFYDSDGDVVRNVRFVGQTKAGIRNWRGAGVVYQGNDYSLLAPGAVPVDTRHLNDVVDVAPDIPDAN